MIIDWLLLGILQLLSDPSCFIQCFLEKTFIWFLEDGQIKAFLCPVSALLEHLNLNILHLFGFIAPEL